MAGIKVSIPAEALVALDKALLAAQQEAAKTDPTLKTHFPQALGIKKPEDAPADHAEDGEISFDSVEALRASMSNMLTPSETVGFGIVIRHP